MEINNEVNVSRWVRERLAALSNDDRWQPDLADGLARLRGQRSSQNKRRKRRFWTAVGIVSALIALAIFPTTRTLAGSYVTTCINKSDRMRAFFFGTAPRSTGSFLTAAPEDRGVAPDFRLKDSSGTTVILSELRGKVVLLHFWATDCSVCGTEIPWFVELQQAFRNRGLVVLGVARDADAWKEVPDSARNPINYRKLIGGDEVFQRYGAIDVTIPVTLIIDKTGRIAGTHTGLCSKSEYESAINELLNEN
jgi:cytochrome c biogenesis protein CcmG/thiol:disulfide interchange protein DsbE